MTAAITGSWKVAPAVGANGPFEAANSTPATPTMAPEVVKTAKRVFLQRNAAGLRGEAVAADGDQWRP